MNEISLNGERICLKVSVLFKTDTLAKMLAFHVMLIWLSRTIPMSKYFSGSRPLRHNEVQLYVKKIICCYLKPVKEMKASSCSAYYYNIGPELYYKKSYITLPRICKINI